MTFLQTIGTKKQNLEKYCNDARPVNVGGTIIIIKSLLYKVIETFKYKKKNSYL